MRKFFKILWLAINPFDKRVDVIRGLVREVAGKDVSGQRKQNWVLNNAVTACPGSSRKDLSFLIERVVQEESK